ncbi:MAG: hypothetical protein KJ063_25695, partial [Anaerolineae bacterium]|nr:hypothetical protein [Anaerolineae bacterium]
AIDFHALYNRLHYCCRQSGQLHDAKITMPYSLSPTDFTPSLSDTGAAGQGPEQEIVQIG